MNAKDYAKKIALGTCIYYTAATFLILFLYFVLFNVSFCVKVSYLIKKLWNQLHFFLICVIIGDILEKRPADADAYMSFFADFNILMIENTMRSLRSLALGEKGSNEIMVELMESNLKRLEKAEKDSLSLKGDLSSVVELVPVGLITIGTIGYCIGLLIVALKTVLTLVG